MKPVVEGGGTEGTTTPQLKESQAPEPSEGTKSLSVVKKDLLRREAASIAEEQRANQMKDEAAAAEKQVTAPW